MTGLCWNTKYFDLFGVAFGSYNFYQENQPGYLAVFSLKVKYRRDAQIPKG